MITPELINYIRVEITKGKKREEIHNILMAGGGWTEEDLSEAFREIIPMSNIVMPESVPTPPAPAPVIEPMIKPVEPIQPQYQPPVQPIVQPKEENPIVREPQQFSNVADEQPLRAKDFSGEMSSVPTFSRALKFIIIIIVVFGLGTAYWFYGDSLNGFFNKQSTSGSVSEVSGHKDDLVSFSFMPGQKVLGKISVKGTVKGGYFNEGNIILNILDSNQHILRSGNARAVGDWMTSAPVAFEGNLDFTLLPPGPAFVQIHNDNASGLSIYDKSILIPVVIE